MPDDFHELLNFGVPDVSKLELLPDDHPMLRTKLPNFKFDSVDGPVPEAIADALATVMLANNGIGLAANQVGLEVRAFCMILGGVPQTMFNPVLSELTDTTHKMMEGCLSFPNLYLKVNRPIGCRLNYQDHHGNRHTVVLTDIEARCAMHEIDHLNGVVFTSKVSKLHLGMQTKKLKKLRK